MSEDRPVEASLVNLADPRQDVHKERAHDPNLNRYAVAERLLPQDSAGLAVLELGGGIAELSRRMQARGMKVAFVDLSDHNIQKAQALGLETHKLDLNRGLPVFADGQFDGIVMLEIIEHVVAVEQLLLEMNRVLKPGGFLILSTPNFAYFQNRVRILFGRLSDDEGYHYRFFTVKSLYRQLRTAGFEIDVPAHTTPAIGINIFRRMMGKNRLHLHVPQPLAPLLSLTLFVRARKVK